MLPTGTHCLHPRYIESHGRMIKIPCGECEACLNVKQSSYELRTEIEASKYRYCYFITLTYNSYHLPLATLHKHTFKNVLDKDKYFYLMCTKLRRSRNYFSRRKLPVTKDGVVLGRINIDDKVNEDYLDMLSLKVKYRRKIPFLNFDDLQKFNKRLRKQISKISYEKIKILSCGEYGPVSFRPHFHLLLMFNDWTIIQKLYKIVRTSWTFGRIDVQSSRGQCSSYVAGYLNSTCKLPRFYRHSSIKPFIRTSKFFGSNISEGQEKEVFETLPFSTPSKDYYFNGNLVTTRLSWQDINRLYPKVREDALITTLERNRRLTLFIRLSDRYGTRSVKDLANEHIKDSHEYSRDTLEQLKRDLYISKSFCRNFDYDPKYIHHALDNYDKLQTRLSLEKLRDFYNSQIEWYNTTEDPNIYSLYYDNHFPNEHTWQMSPTLEVWDVKPENYRWYDEYKSQVHTRFEKSIKHKKLNDLNNIFL